MKGIKKMKRIKYIILTIIFILLLSLPIFVNAQHTIYGKYKVNNLELISYSSHWNEEKLKELYIELLSNFHGNEFNYLSTIYLYPDSPQGVSGNYYEDIALKNGNYTCGNKAYIELFDMDKNNTIKKVARTLSHEYGHHYTIYNMLLTEGKYYTQWANSEYAKIRGLSEYPVFYGYNSEGSNYKWDVTEIMAEDYVQLLGSPIAKISTDYPDGIEMLEKNISQSYADTKSFNLMPQKNPYLPLAADVNGLYKFLYSLSGYKTTDIKESKPAEITSVKMDYNEKGKKEYTIKWSEASGNSPYEYTLVMYPVSNPFVPVPLKTVTDKEELSAKIGNIALKDSDNNIKELNADYEGDYEFIVYYKDNQSLIHKSKPYQYSFGNEEFIKDNSVGDSSDYTPNGNIDYSKIIIDEDFEYDEFFDELYVDFSKKISFNSYFCDIIKWMRNLLN